MDLVQNIGDNISRKHAILSAIALLLLSSMAAAYTLPVSTIEADVTSVPDDSISEEPQILTGTTQTLQVTPYTALYTMKNGCDYIERPEDTEIQRCEVNLGGAL